MKNMLLVLFALGIGLKVTAQMAVIEDKDGYTNVRQEPNIKSEIIHKINEGEVFFIGLEINGWTTVHLSYDKFSQDIIRRGTMRGYVHSSRIRSLNKISKYVGDEFSFQYEIVPFTKEGKTIQYQGDDERYVDRINEDYFWGTDGDLPKKEVKALNISVNGNKIEVPDNLLTDIYEIRSNLEYYKISDSFIVFHNNSDGAGYYEICWVFDKNGLKQRLVGNPN